MPIEINLLILAHNIEVQNKMSTGIVSIDMVYIKTLFSFIYYVI